ncbi:MAG: ABC-type Fe3+-hydroxamate transport system, periplasmic component [Candidatus Nanosalina sp. J07AB43]|nr:MAG: ABC-type Fe3+-hydroxamate transport system, periplasmic component [Candidatus Nanosalina sp. J07AB43]
MDIISLAPSNTEILYEIGAEDDIVATTSLCDYPAKAARKPSIGGWTNPKISRIHEFDPDLVLASDDLQDEAVEEIEAEGYPVLQVKPHSLEEVYKSIVKIGERVNRGKEAQKLVKQMKNRIEAVELENNPRIYCEEWMDPPMISGNWIPDLMHTLGAQYMIETGRSQEFSLDDLEDFDPEHIIFHVCGSGENLDAKDIIQNRSEWQQISAVKNQNIYTVDDSLLNRPGPRLAEAAEKIKEIVDG